MGSANKGSLIVAASLGAVEALKDQAGLCRWNYALRSLQQRAKGGNAGSLSQAMRASSSSSSSSSVDRRKVMDREAKARKEEESLRTVMYLSCWGPN
ncbi:uncharacterized protein LOC109724583 [Ananas comosus]|uniref:Uncharacterized protein LOC109724583 n=1 Tax=Ananas comosus TaxID=4615 RepID=A0A6P5GU76_ANACO|nr:uncharacterized protein LOC109724583 [Ananas comosus]